MLYQYVACSESGQIVKGKMTAEKEESVTEMLAYAGYRLINLRPYVPFISSSKFTQGLFPVKPQEVNMIYRQLALLIESGVNIALALELLQEQITNRTLKKVMHEVVTDIRAGNQLSAAMAKHPDIFNVMNTRTVSIGEQTGGLETMLRQVADYNEKEFASRKGIKGAMMYPIIAIVVCIGVVGLLMFFVLPAFAGLYGDLGAEMPVLMSGMLKMSDILHEYWQVMFLVLFGVIGFVMIYLRTEDGKFNMDKLVLKVPLLGRVKHLNELARASRSISLLYTAGLPLTEIMPLVIQGCGNRVMARSLNEVHAEMLRGEGLSKPMAQNPIFLPMMVQMVKVGEETGSLDASLQAVANNYETEAQDKTKALIAMIQPVMTIVIAGIVGIIAISMVSAMYSMYGQAF
jgi:type IV pilus assembly protein PilC